MRYFAPALTALFLAGCDYAPTPEPEQNEGRLMSACGETTRLLGQMKSAESSFSYDQEGNARIRKALWTALPANMQESLINAIGYAAVCASGQPGEQVVTIRSSDGSEVLAQQTVTEFDR